MDSNRAKRSPSPSAKSGLGVYEGSIDEKERELILFTQYPMTKEGKRMGTREKRLFSIYASTHQIFQCKPGTGERKPLPQPSKVTRRLLELTVEFVDRTPIWIDFTKEVECREIHAFLLARKWNGVATFKHCPKLLRTQAAYQLAKRLISETAYNKASQVSRAQAVKNTIDLNFSPLSLGRQLLNKWWQVATLKESQTPLGPFSLNIVTLLLPPSFPSTWKATLKIWVGQSVAAFLQSTTISQTSNYGSTECRFYQIKCTISPQSFNDQVKFYLETADNEKWISESTSLAIIKGSYIRKQSITLWGSSIYRLCLLVDWSSLEVTIPQSLQNSTIHPRWNAIIDYIKADGNQIRNNTTNWSSVGGISFEIRMNTFQYIGFKRLKMLLRSLGVRSFIQKCASSSPFNQTAGIEEQYGSFIYAYLCSRHQSSPIHFYDVERCQFTYLRPEMSGAQKRVLTALKIFDSYSRINFSYPLYELSLFFLSSLRCYPTTNWAGFLPVLESVEALSFFLLLACVKSFPKLFVNDQIPGSGFLSKNTNHFLILLGRYIPSIRDLLLRIELNVGATFGKALTSLMSLYAPTEVFSELIEKTLKGKDKETGLMHHYIGYFLAIIQLASMSSVACQSAENFLAVLKTIPFSTYDKLSVDRFARKWTGLSVELEADPFVTGWYEYLEGLYEEKSESSAFLTSRVRSPADQQGSDQSKLGSFAYICQELYYIATYNPTPNSVGAICLYLRVYSLNLLTKSKKNVRVSAFQGNQLLKSIYVDYPIQKAQSIPIILLEIQGYEDIRLEFNLTDASAVAMECVFQPKYLSQTTSNYYCKILKANNVELASKLFGASVGFEVWRKYGLIVGVNHIKQAPQLYLQTLGLLNPKSHEILAHLHEIAAYTMGHAANLVALYAACKWFGCHYEIPEHRVLNIVPFSKETNQESFQINAYSRLVYGVGLPPLRSKQKRLVMRGAVGLLYERQKLAIQSAGSFKKSKAASPNEGETIQGFGFPLPCLDSTDISSDEFLSKMNRLPLIRYLLYEPKVPYQILPRLNLLLKPHQSLDPQKPWCEPSLPIKLSWSTFYGIRLSMRSRVLPIAPSEGDAALNFGMSPELYSMRLEYFFRLLLDKISLVQPVGSFWSRTSSYRLRWAKQFSGQRLHHFLYSILFGLTEGSMLSPAELDVLPMASASLIAEKAAGKAVKQFLLCNGRYRQCEPMNTYKYNGVIYRCANDGTLFIIMESGAAGY